ncbi:Guanine nucleotide-binding protein alpha-4 subunit [Termitomyces sp. T112]|nr:Guanine nucleotide-binding protein alpha-4 subunit [Termitomyces sp. T112]
MDDMPRTPPWDIPTPSFRHGLDRNYLGRSAEEATRISQEIDEELLASKKALDKRRRAVQILLLGQSESGKSSVIKNFQLAFAPKEFEKERLVWRTIIQLNLIMSLKLILEILSHEWESLIIPDGRNPHPLTRELRRIRLSLSPLLFVGQNAMQIIGPGTEDPHNVCVRPGSNWKALIRERLDLSLDLDLNSTCVKDERRDRNGDGNGNLNRNRRSQNPLTKEIDPTPVLVASKNDIEELWKDTRVRAVLKRRGVKMEEMPGFFLDDLGRIADQDYVPTDSDIMRARVRTLGVEEHRFLINRGLELGSEVYIIDVGGSRSQRPKWIPYFEDVQTILFLAPLTFDRALEEDPEINRLEDSLMLWREICRNKILAKATLILFFNKTDVLRRTLEAGVKVKKYVPSYGDLPNEVGPVTKYFCDKFRTYHQKLSPVHRPFMYHETSAIDTSSMAALLLGVQETILRTYLKQGEML